jgi:hypothetical protein
VFGNAQRDLTLDFEDVGGREFPIVRLGPQVSVGFRVNQLNVDAHPVRGGLDTTFEDRLHSQFSSDLADRLWRVPVVEHRGARRDLQRTDLRQLGENVVVDSDREWLRFVGATHVRERQNGDRLHGVRGQFGTAHGRARRILTSKSGTEEDPPSRENAPQGKCGDATRHGVSPREQTQRRIEGLLRPQWQVWIGIGLAFGEWLVGQRL